MSPRLLPGSLRCRYRPTRQPCRRAGWRCRSPAAASRTEEGAVWINRPVSLAVVAAVVLLAGFSSRTIAAQTDVAKGEYLARAGDCIACHTNPGGALFAGGLAMATPFGTIY